MATRRASREVTAKGKSRIPESASFSGGKRRSSLIRIAAPNRPASDAAMGNTSGIMCTCWWLSHDPPRRQGSRSVRLGRRDSTCDLRQGLRWRWERTSRSRPKKPRRKRPAAIDRSGTSPGARTGRPLVRQRWTPTPKLRRSVPLPRQAEDLLHGVSEGLHVRHQAGAWLRFRARGPGDGQVRHSQMPRSSALTVGAFATSFSSLARMRRMETEDRGGLRRRHRSIPFKPIISLVEYSGRPLTSV